MCQHIFLDNYKAIEIKPSIELRIKNKYWRIFAFIKYYKAPSVLNIYFLRVSLLFLWKIKKHSEIKYIFYNREYTKTIYWQVRYILQSFKRKTVNLIKTEG
jgi:hypothetical protein